MPLRVPAGGAVLVREHPSGARPGSTLPDALDPVTYRQADGSTATDLYIRQDRFRHQFAADVSAGQAALMAAEQRPIAQSALEEMATSAAWKTKPSWAIVTTRDLNIPAAVQRFMAKRAHAHTVEVAASHSVAVSRPRLVAELDPGSPWYAPMTVRQEPCWSCRVTRSPGPI
ncbi:alpha/beta hydrolase [Streptomyces sp. NPDC102395]|uniref:alpha/beta hydrolase n=1 Tax=Streptomyces sp. NPDC102395 TaxID=3366168 RepID=UPI0038124A56